MNRSRLRDLVLAGARCLDLERPLIRLRRRFLPAYVRADIRDTDLMAALIARVVTPRDVCFDVGAHRGTVLAAMVAAAPGQRHVAWEPIPSLAAALAAEFPSVEVRAAALSDFEGRANFQVALDEPGWSGFRSRPTPADSRFQTIDVRCERLDALALPDPALIKIDVEGAEMAVLRGAREVLRRARPVLIFEHGAGAADLYGSGPTEVWDLLCAELGYAIRGLDGDGPYTRAAFGDEFARGRRVNFVASVERDAPLHGRVGDEPEQAQD